MSRYGRWYAGATMLRGARTRGLVVLTATLALAAGTARAQYPNPLPTSQAGGGAVVAADPSLLIRSSAPRYLLFSTANNEERQSTDRTTWTTATPAMAPPAWWLTDTRGWQTWAPDVSFHNTKYWMYYVRSEGFGSQNVRIGLATSTPPQGTADPGTWIDQGEVLRSTKGVDNFRALDPNLFVDGNGKFYLSWGSFYDGIFLQEVDPTTGKPLYFAQRVKIAQRPAPATVPPDGHDRSIEAPFIFKRGGYYYLFVSFGLCCQEPFDYDVRVGRSTSVTGPYTGPAGVDMRDGGGAKILGGHPPIVAPGGQSVVHDPIKNEDLLVYHYVTSKNPLRRALAINRLGWDADGWPYVK